MSRIETKGDLLNYVTKMAIEYAPKCKDSVVRNSHMNEIDGYLMSEVDQDCIDAILVDFVNYIGMNQGLDWGLYTKDLEEGKLGVNHDG